MSTTFNAALDSYLRAKTLSRGTRGEYHSTVRKCESPGEGGQELLPADEPRRAGTPQEHPAGERYPGSCRYQCLAVRRESEIAASLGQASEELPG